MGFLRKIRTNIRQRLHKRRDDVTLTTYDMSEIAGSDDEFDPFGTSRNELRGLPSPSGQNDRLTSPLLLQVEIPPSIIEPSASSLSFSEMSDKAMRILSASFPYSAFDKNLVDNEEDLSQYPDPDLLHLSDFSSDEEEDQTKREEDEKSEGTFHGLLIDTSSQSGQPSKADENDEYLVDSPSEAKQSQEVMQPRSTKNLAHIFTEELSTLYEDTEYDDEASLTSISDQCSKEADGGCDTGKHENAISPKEQSIRDRWNYILEMTMTGQCTDGYMDEGEI